jgi:hypothetical protein
MQRLILPGGAYQFLVAAGLDNPPVTKHYDQVGTLHGSNSMSHDERSAVALQLFQGCRHHRLGVGIEGSDALTLAYSSAPAMPAAKIVR